MPSQAEGRESRKYPTLSRISQLLSCSFLLETLKMRNPVDPAGHSPFQQLRINAEKALLSRGRNRDCSLELSAALCCSAGRAQSGFLSCCAPKDPQEILPELRESKLSQPAEPTVQGFRGKTEK